MPRSERTARYHSQVSVNAWIWGRRLPALLPEQHVVVAVRVEGRIEVDQICRLVLGMVPEDVAVIVLGRVGHDTDSSVGLM